LIKCFGLYPFGIPILLKKGCEEDKPPRTMLNRSTNKRRELDGSRLNGLPPVY